MRIDGFFNLIKREMRICLKNSFVMISFSSFFLISILIFLFLHFGSGSIDGDKLYKPIVWVLLIFSMMLISENFTNNDYADGSLKNAISWLFRRSHYIIKGHCHVVYDYVANIFFDPNFFYLIQCNFYKFCDFVFKYLFSLSKSNSNFFGFITFSIQLKNNKIIQFIIIFPFYIPIIIFTTSTTNNDIDGYIFDDNNFLILIGIFFITLPISLLTSKLIMKEINR